MTMRALGTCSKSEMSPDSSNPTETTPAHPQPSRSIFSHGAKKHCPRTNTCKLLLANWRQSKMAPCLPTFRNSEVRTWLLQMHGASAKHIFSPLLPLQKPWVSGVSSLCEESQDKGGTVLINKSTKKCSYSQDPQLSFLSSLLLFAADIKTYGSSPLEIFPFFHDSFPGKLSHLAFAFHKCFEMLVPFLSQTHPRATPVSPPYKRIPVRFFIPTILGTPHQSPLSKYLKSFFRCFILFF